MGARRSRGPCARTRRELDATISDYAEDWTADRLGAVERNVLRIALKELERGEVPMEVVLDEAVRLAKRYASDDAGRLVNGILGRVVREQSRVVSAEESLQRAEELLAQLEETRAELERLSESEDVDGAIEALTRLSRAREGGRGRARSGRGGRPTLPRRPDELRAAVEDYLAELALTPELDGLEEPMRYALAGGGKRVRPVLCLATGGGGRRRRRARAPGRGRGRARPHVLARPRRPAGARRRRRAARAADGARAASARTWPSCRATRCSTEAFRLALSYASTGVARELAQATLGMIGGQYLDLRGEGVDEDAVNRLKTGRLFDAAVACGLWAAEVPEPSQPPWRAFAAELGAALPGGRRPPRRRRLGADARRGVDAAGRGRRGRARPRGARGGSADTSVLAEIVETLAARTS